MSDPWTPNPNQPKNYYENAPSYVDPETNQVISPDNGYVWNSDLGQWTKGINNEAGTNWLGWGNLALKAISTPFNIYAGIQSLNMAKKQYNLAKDAFAWQKRIDTANMNNAIQTTNTALADRAAARASGAYGQGTAAADAYTNDYIKKNSLNVNW